MKTYEELTGAQGRAMFYRADRYTARELFRGVVPELEIDRTEYFLEDISLSGIGARTAPGINDVCDIGERVRIDLAFRGIPLFQGTGQIARVDPTPRGTKIGIRLVDSCFAIAQIVAKYQEVLVRTGLEEITRGAIAVPSEYRALSGDVLHLLRGYRAALLRFTDTKPHEAAIEEMLIACEDRILPRWRALWHAANKIVAPLMADEVARRSVKEFSEVVLVPDFMRGPIWRRSYEKPHGYPGDFQVMNMVYAWCREGEQLGDRLIHRLGLDVAECIATRMVLMREAIANTVLASSSGTAHIASLGCGPAREVADYLQLRKLPRAAQFTLIDQDHAALSQAYEQTYPETMRLHGQATVNCLHTSFTQLLKAGELFGKLPPQDLIYTVGLVDYLSQHRAQSLVNSLYAQLAPGGTLLIGNMMDTPISNLWPMEFLCDWSIVYRDEAAMRNLAAELPVAAVDFRLDSTGRVCVLSVRKSETPPKPH
jgi:extracellular factor (EF) 3-hydroxypalmitic acid methyl ester biosynthesis protein